jgi:inner membrane protein
MASTPNNLGFIPSLRNHAATCKLAGIALLVILLLIPLTMIRSVLRERLDRRDNAVAGITSTWGNEQVVVGPVLIVPYRYKTKAWKEENVNGKIERIAIEEVAIANAFFLPDRLNIESDIAPSKLHRGIYDTVVYEGNLKLSGRFVKPNFPELDIAETEVLWANASISVAVSDLRGTGEMLQIEFDKKKYDFNPGCKLEGYPSGVHARLLDFESTGTEHPFLMSLDLKGSRGIRFAPIGQQNLVKMTSAWASPSFGGAFLPTKRNLSDKGFDASWEVSWYGRDYPQQGSDQGGSSAINAQTIAPSLFGVDFLALLDAYRMVERAIKYGVLFIALIFVAFFLFETLSALRIHTIQYTLVGGALCLFYLAVLSLSEFISFLNAYAIGAFASSLLIVLYSYKVLGSGKRTGIIAVALLAIYSYLYVILQMQDYSLLFGTVALFVVLGIVMYLTRNLDWSAKE